MAQLNDSQMECQMFKGLQRPLEFMGLQSGQPLKVIEYAALQAVKKV